MGKKGNKGNNSLGKSLIRSRFSGNKPGGHRGDPSLLHTSDLQDGYSWGRLNLQSVTEESSFQEFLTTAELAGTEFEAEKLNIKFVKPTSDRTTKCNPEDIQKVNKEILRIPRRPAWDKTTTPAELDAAERESFLQWRRELALFQEQDDSIILTPYEKNLEFWRQLWRVIERSDVIVQIVDARSPLMYRCQDLEAYVKEVSSHKMNLLLINKADFLTEEQRNDWVRYFNNEGIRVLFFSATSELENANEETDDISQLIENLSINQNESRLLTRTELIHYFRMCHQAPKVTPCKTTIGLVGYPNVGKSSTLNALLQAKCVAVSATPGKTKHFQTFPLSEDLVLCDCPGLVMPSAVQSKADMVLNGILPVDQLREHLPPISLICERFPSGILAKLYGLMLPETVTPEVLLNAFGFNRGFMTANGQPDNPRAARVILKDYVNGKLLYCHSPPDSCQEKFHIFPEVETKTLEEHADVRYKRAVRAGTSESDMNKEFFKQPTPIAHVKGVQRLLAGSVMSDEDAKAMVANQLGKPWKLINKHANKKKREKLRRVYVELDQH